MSHSVPRPDVYFSADIETDGPVPGPYSMLSFGLAVVGRYDGSFTRIEPTPSVTFYRELQPISDQFDAEALAVNGLDRSGLVEHGDLPSDAMAAAAEWVMSVAEGCRPVLVAYPVVFDWSFLYWYFVQFNGGVSPFGHSSCLDIRTLYQAVSGAVFDESGKEAMPEFIRGSRPHTHNALDDAIEQGELFANLFEYARARRNAWAHGTRDAEPMPSWIRQQMISIS